MTTELDYEKELNKVYDEWYQKLSSEDKVGYFKYMLAKYGVNGQQMSGPSSIKFKGK